MVSIFKNVNAGLLLVLAIATQFFSCDIEEEIEYEDFGYKPQLSVHGYISDLSGAMVEVSRTVNPLTPFGEQVDNSVQNARVWLIDGSGLRTELIESEPGYFTTHSGFKPLHSTKYSIEVVADGFGTATSEPQVLPAPAQIDSAIIHTDDAMATIFVHIADVDPLPNYYDFARIVHHSGLPPDHIINPRNRYWFHLSAVPDNSFAGNQYTYSSSFSIVYSYYDWVERKDINSKADSVTISICSLSPNIIEFLTSKDNWNGLNQNPFIDSPPQIISNISGGVGFFSAFSEKLFRFYF